MGKCMIFLTQRPKMLWTIVWNGMVCMHYKYSQVLQLFSCDNQTTLRTNNMKTLTNLQVEDAALTRLSMTDTSHMYMPTPQGSATPQESGKSCNEDWTARMLQVTSWLHHQIHRSNFVTFSMKQTRWRIVNLDMTSTVEANEGGWDYGWNTVVPTSAIINKKGGKCSYQWGNSNNHPEYNRFKLKRTDHSNTSMWLHQNTVAMQQSYGL
jgi:hypothetical protein